MAKVYFVTERQEYTFRNKLERELLIAGHTMVPRNIIPGANEDEQYIEKFQEADVIIIMFTPTAIEEDYFKQYLDLLRTFINSKLIIPLLIDGIKQEDLPDPYKNSIGIKFPNRSNAEVSSAIQTMLNSINKYAKKIKVEKIEKTAATFVDEALTSLRNRESSFKWTAIIFYVLGLIGILAGIGGAIWYSEETISSISKNPSNAVGQNWILLLYYIFKGIIIIILLIAASKYCFTLGKAYMNESLKNADRIHAISFGKLYLQVSNEITPSELKEIFRDWNILNTSPFILQSTNEFDPNFFEKFNTALDRFMSFAEKREKKDKKEVDVSV